MKFLSFLILLLFTSPIAFSETILLKSGKRLEGSVVSEDSNGIRLREAGGVILRIRLDQIASRISPEVSISAEPAAAEKRKARVYTKEDLERTPQLSEVSSVDLPEATEEPEPAPAQDYESWRNDAEKLRQRSELLRSELQEAEEDCKQAKEHPVVVARKRGVVFYDPAKLPPECEAVEKIRERLEEAEQRWNEFTERARRGGIPWSILDP